MRNLINLVETAQGEIVYHGSINRVGDIRHSEIGMFFTANRASAEAYARGPDEDEEGEVISARLNLRNPLTISSEWIDELQAQHSEMIEQAKKQSGSTLSLEEAFEDSELWAREIVFQTAHRLGHDAVILPRDLLPELALNGDWGYFPTYAVFDASCIEIIDRKPVEPIDE